VSAWRLDDYTLHASTRLYGRSTAIPLPSDDCCKAGHVSFFSVGRRMVYDGRNALELESNRSGNRHRVIRLGLFDEDLTA